MKMKNIMPSRKIGGVYSPCMETVLIDTLQYEIDKLRFDISISKSAHLNEGNQDLNDMPSWRIMNINELEEKVNTLLYYQEKAHNKLLKRRKK